MSQPIREAAISVLEPLVGRAMATVYIADAAHGTGKTADELQPSDVATVCDVLRSKISPFAARPVIDQAMADITYRTRV